MRTGASLLLQLDGVASPSTFSSSLTLSINTISLDLRDGEDRVTGIEELSTFSSVFSTVVVASSRDFCNSIRSS